MRAETRALKREAKRRGQGVRGRAVKKKT